VDKYESLLPLNGLLRTPKEGEKHLRTFAQSAQNVNLKWMLEAAAEKCAASAEQLRARTRGLRREPVSAGSVSGAIGSDDHVILAESERKQHMAKNEYEGERDLAQIDESSPLPHELHRTDKNSGLMDRTREERPTLPESHASRKTDDSPASNPPPSGVGHPPGQPGGPVKLETPSLLPGSDGEHALQAKYASGDRANTFYARQVLNFLAPRMREFISRQEFMFVGTADRHGECDCSPRFGEPGFIHVLGNKHLLYPEYRGNGVFASQGNISENPHIALLIIDFYRDSVGLHVNGKARIVQSEELEAFADKLPEDALAELAKEGKRRPNGWVMVEVEEAYIQCSKHIPLLRKLERSIDWGTDSVAAKKGDYFELKDIPLYDRIGGDQAMEIAVDLFQRKLLEDDLVGRFFDDVDSAAQRLKQKSFLVMAFGGPCQYSGDDLRKLHEMGLEPRHFDRVSAILKETLEELKVGAPEIEEVMQAIEITRETILNLWW
jgi:truncated hemoglobin YjbI/predicted pyridoxine 5'-phosphate oxidase superfamily flavin-nucleotide-binding protein